MDTFNFTVPGAVADASAFHREIIGVSISPALLASARRSFAFPSGANVSGAGRVRDVTAVYGNFKLAFEAWLSGVVEFNRAIREHVRR